MRQAYEFQDLQSFLNVYYAGMSVLRDEEDFLELANAYFARAKADGVVHSELFFDPQAHVSRGVKLEVVLAGLTKAVRQSQEVFGVSSRLIMCFLRDLSAESAMDTLKAVEVRDAEIIAVGLDSAEVGNPPSKFKEVFEAALARGYLTVAHAGEEGPPQYIWEALNLLKVSRIDHGVRCMEDPKLVEHLKEKDIPLTVCPLSNVKLKVVNDLKQHNLKKMLDAGLKVLVNSDDPAYFGGYIAKNLEDTTAALDLSDADLYTLAKNSIEASFIEPALKQNYLSKLDGWRAS